MNDFTKEELERLLSDHWSSGANFPGLYDKIKYMIDNHHNIYGAKRIAQYNLNEASSLISHAMCLLGMDDN